MNKTYRIELKRIFLLQNLPEPLTRASEHFQYFDNFIENTRLVLRSVRAPHTKEWKWILEQREPVTPDDLSAWRISEIYLNETEHQAFESFEGREVSKNERVETNELRYNRYFYEENKAKYEIDVFLNPLWGLTLASVCFDSKDDLRRFDPPVFVLAEVTQNAFFIGKNLIGKNFADVRKEFEKIKSEQ